MEKLRKPKQSAFEFSEKAANERSISNTFLIETANNSDIGEDLRDEIEKKFSKSKPNATYRFPRKATTAKRPQKKKSCLLKTPRKTTNRSDKKLSIFRKSKLRSYLAHKVASLSDPKIAMLLSKTPSPGLFVKKNRISTKSARFLNKKI